MRFSPQPLQQSQCTTRHSVIWHSAIIRVVAPWQCRTSFSLINQVIDVSIIHILQLAWDLDWASECLSEGFKTLEQCHTLCTEDLYEWSAQILPREKDILKSWTNRAKIHQLLIKELYDTSKPRFCTDWRVAGTTTLETFSLACFYEAWGGHLSSELTGLHFGLMPKEWAHNIIWGLLLSCLVSETHKFRFEHWENE